MPRASVHPPRGIPHDIRFRRRQKQRRSDVSGTKLRHSESWYARDFHDLQIARELDKGRPDERPFTHSVPTKHGLDQLLANRS